MYYYEMTLNRKDAYAIMIAWTMSMNYGPEVRKYVIVDRCDSNKIILGLAISEKYIFYKNSILEDKCFLQILISRSYRLRKIFGNNIGIKIYKRIRFKFYPVDYPGIENYVVVENYSFTGPTYYTSQITHMVAGKIIGIIQGTCIQYKGENKDTEFLIKVNENQENKQKINWNKIEIL